MNNSQLAAQYLNELMGIYGTPNTDGTISAEQGIIWTNTDSSGAYTSKSIGINTIASTYELEISGNTYVKGDLVVDGTLVLNSSVLGEINTKFLEYDMSFTNVEAKFGEYDTSFTRVQEKFGGYDTSFTNVQQKFTAYDTSFTNVQQKFAAYDTSFTNVQQKFTAYDTSFTNVQEKFTAYDTSFTNVQQKFGIIDTSINGLTLKNAYNTLDYSFNFGTTISSINVINNVFPFNSLSVSTFGTYQIGFNQNVTDYMYISSNSGQSFTPITNAGRKQWGSVSISADGKYQIACVYYYAPDRDYYYTSSNYGDTWTAATTLAYWREVAVSETGKYQIACSDWLSAGNNPKYFFYSYNYGISWNIKYVGITSSNGYIRKLCISANGKYQAIFNEKAPKEIYVSTNYGLDWTYRLSLSYEPTYLLITPNGKCIVVAYSNKIYISKDYGTSWANYTLPTIANKYSISKNGQYHVYTLSNNLYISYNYGETWSTLNINSLFSYQSNALYNVSIQFTYDKLIFLMNDELTSNYIISIPHNSIGNNIVSSSIQNYIIDSPTSSSIPILLPSLSNIPNGTLFKFSNRNSVSHLFTSVDCSLIYIADSLNAITEIPANGSLTLSANPNVGWISIIDSTNAVYDYNFTTINSSISNINSKFTSNVLDFSFNFGDVSSNINASEIIYGSAVSSNGKYQLTSSYNGYLYVSSNFGLQWTPKITDISRYWRSAAMSATGQYQTACVYSATHYGFIYVSSDYGNNWAPKVTDTSRNWISVAVSATGQYQTACVPYWKIYISTDYGTTWIEKDSNRNWKSVAVSATGQYQTACSYNDNIYSSTDYGVNWNPKTNVNPNFICVAMSATGKYQTVGVNNGNLYISSDYGETWTMSASVKSWNSVAISPTGQHQVACTFLGNIWISKNYGITWTTLNNEVKSYRSIAFSYNTLLVGTDSNWYNINNYTSGNQSIFSTTTNYVVDSPNSSATYLTLPSLSSISDGTVYTFLNRNSISHLLTSVDLSNITITNVSSIVAEIPANGELILSAKPSSGWVAVNTSPTIISKAYPTLITANTTLTGTLYQYYVVNNSNEITITLPAITQSNLGSEITFRRIDTTYTIYISAYSAQNIVNISNASANSITMTISAPYMVKLVAMIIDATPTYAWIQTQ